MAATEPAQPYPPHPAQLHGARVRLVAVAAEHVEDLVAIRRRPEVFTWWSHVEEDFPFDEGPGTPGFAVLLDGRVIGFVQYSEEDDPMYRTAWMDVFLDPDVHGQGLGREVVATVAAHLVDGRGHHRLLIDPAAANAAAIACYAAVGFKPVGVMRQAELSPEGTWRDSLLMDLLAGELVRPHVTPDVIPGSGGAG